MDLHKIEQRRRSDGIWSAVVRSWAHFLGRGLHSPVLAGCLPLVIPPHLKLRR